jgi:hypothetical protein
MERNLPTRRCVSGAIRNPEVAGLRRFVAIAVSLYGIYDTLYITGYLTPVLRFMYYYYLIFV